jgi:hypothetical protein
MHQSKNTTPLVICNHSHHPTGVYGCFRCIDHELLQNLLSMIDKNKVEVFSVTRYRDPIFKGKGDKVPDTDAKLFFNFLHENNICFKTFFTKNAFIKEYNNVQILKTIPIVINEYGREQAVAVGEQAVAVGEEKGEQPNFLQKFTTYYEYPYYDAAGHPQQSCAFILEFLDNVEILQQEYRWGGTKRISIKTLYILLNKLCNNKMTIEQKLDPKFKSEILDALKILNSYGYRHADTHLENVVDCGSSSQPQYKLIDFGNMEKMSQQYYFSDEHAFTKEIDIASWEAWAAQAAEKKAAAEANAAAKAKAAAEANAAQYAEYTTKFDKVKKDFHKLIKQFRSMVNAYMSEYFYSKCSQASMLTSSHENEYDPQIEYSNFPQVTFTFTSSDDLIKCGENLGGQFYLDKVKEKPALFVKEEKSSGLVSRIYEYSREQQLRLGVDANGRPKGLPSGVPPSSVKAICSSGRVEQLFNDSTKHDETSPLYIKLQEMSQYISSIRTFLEKKRQDPMFTYPQPDYMSELDTYFKFIDDEFPEKVVATGPPRLLSHEDMKERKLDENKKGFPMVSAATTKRMEFGRIGMVNHDNHDLEFGGKRTKKRKQKRSTNKKRRIHKKRGRISKRR